MSPTTSVSSGESENLWEQLQANQKKIKETSLKTLVGIKKATSLKRSQIEILKRLIELSEERIKMAKEAPIKEQAPSHSITPLSSPRSFTVHLNSSSGGFSQPSLSRSSSGDSTY